MEEFNQEVFLVIIGAVSGIAASGLVGGIGYLCKRRYDKSDKTNELRNQIEEAESHIRTDLSSELGLSSGDRSISSQLGVQDGASLASRIDGVSELITDKFDRNAKRLQKLNKRQEELKTKVSDISDVMEDWQRLTLENTQLIAENEQLKVNNAHLNNRIAQLEQDSEQY